MSFSRRLFLKSGIAGLAAVNLPGHSSAREPEPKLVMGIIADLHHGLEPTAVRRLDTFMQSVDQRKPDCILQLGDFNYGKPNSKECMSLWNQFTGSKYHVLGNHDMDSFSKQHMIDFWGMPDRYYSFDAGGFHFIVLDRNNLFVDGQFEPYKTANFYVAAKHRGFADDRQLQWLKEDLAKSNWPTVVFAHQGLGMEKDTAKVSAACAPIEQALAEANSDNQTRVVACFCGHHHIDRYNFKDSIHYVWINSASYYWVGAKYGRMAPYQDSLFCFASFYADGSIEIEGRRSDWASPTPAARGYPNAERLTTYISDRKLPAGRRQ